LNFERCFQHRNDRQVFRPAGHRLGANQVSQRQHPHRVASDVHLDTGATTVNAEANISIAKTDGVTSVVPSQYTLTYTVVVSNTGPNDVAGTTVADTFPTELTNLQLTTTPPADGPTSSLAMGTLTGALRDTVNLPAGCLINSG